MNAPVPWSGEQKPSRTLGVALPRMLQPHPLVTLYLGDCREVLKQLHNVHACVTDPPYGLRFMGNAWDYDVPEIETWQLVREAMLPGSHLLSFFGTRTAHRGVTKIEDAGFEIRDQILWIYGSGFPKSHNLDGKWDGWGTALKPAHEPICVARIPICGTVAENVQAHGTGALNVNSCRIPSDEPVQSAAGLPGFGANREDGYVSGTGRKYKTGNKHSLSAWRKAEGRDDLPGNHPEMTGGHKDGRWPANVIHDGSDEVLCLFAAAGTNKGGGFPQSRKSAKTSGIFGAFKKGHIQQGPRDMGSGSAARFFYCAKASRSEREAGLENLEAEKAEGFDGYNEREWIDRKDGKGRVPVSAKRQPRCNTHPTVKPLALMEYLVKLVTREGQTVLDPFMGSGTTGIAALRLGRRFIGIERDERSFEIALWRMKRAAQERALI
jgi:site-specific DNA-methyltransferase (adenine-specific)